MKKGLLAWLLVTAASVAAPASAELPTWRPAVQTDPLEFGSPRLESGFANIPEPGEWDVSFAATQFNVWNHTWHTFALHREHDRIGEEVTSEQLRQIERNFFADDAWHLDLEGWRSDLIVTRGLTNGMSASVKVPYIEFGRPHWDGFAEGFHELLEIDTLQREIFPRHDTLIYIKDAGNEHIIEAREELNGSGIGDVSLALAMPLRERWGARHRLVISAELPTGDRDTLRGSGGVDANVSWFARWEFAKPRGTRTMTFAAGYSWLDPGGEWLGFERTEHLGHLSFGVDQPLWKNLYGTFALRLDTSALWSISEAHPGLPATFYRLGLMADAGRAGWFGLELGEELQPQTGGEADWSFHLIWGQRLGR